MRNRNRVRVFSHGGSWFVGVGRGYYNRPLEKAVAIEQARELARSRSESRRSPDSIDVFGDDGELLEQIA